ncbi:MAG: neutral/alkaline non-lysosomal ceramidase N-terminal domain-containing protein [Adhaeribacter sp.]
MKKLTWIVALFLLGQAPLWVLGQPGAGWRAGVARVNITPKQPMWMAGFASRVTPSDGTRHALWGKALALQDATGKQAVLVTLDLLGLPKAVSDHIRQGVEARYQLSKAQIILNSSHTHSAPVLENALVDIYPMDAAEKEKVLHYSRQLEQQLIALVGSALKGMKPAQVFAQNGVTRFQVNRRNNTEAKLTQLTELKGPNDYSVPVIKVLNAKGKLQAIAFGYACHPTVLNDNKWSGDYVGFAQLELEKEFPGATALFFQGAGADQNPLPRRTEALARQYGRELAAAVSRVLSEPMQPLSPTLATAYSEVALPLQPTPGREELAQLAAKPAMDYTKRWAIRQLEQLNLGVTFPTSYPYPLQVWKLGDQVLMALGGELVVDYALKLKQLFGPATFVLGYSNDVMGYIPSVRVLKEGGYEGASSQMVYGQPALWAPELESTILTEMARLARQAGATEAKN